MSTIRRILVLAEGQLGDLLLLTPALRAIKQTFRDANLSVLIVSRTFHGMNLTDLSPSSAFRESNVLSTNPHVDTLYHVSRPFLRSMKGIKRVRTEYSIIRFLRQKRFDAVISTFPEDRFAIWSFLSGATKRIGQKKQTLSRLYSIRPDVNKFDGGVLEYYCALAGSLGAVSGSKVTEFHIPLLCSEWAESELMRNGIRRADHFIALHAGASGSYKIWPPERYAALINALQKRNGVRVVLCQGTLDVEICEAIAQQMETRPIQIQTGENVGNFAALLSRASLLISNDSGPRHLAVAVKTPSLALFRRFHDREWKVYPDSDECVVATGKEECPSCPPGVCLDRIPDGERFGSHCLRMLSVDDVLSIAMSMLASR